MKRFIVYAVIVVALIGLGLVGVAKVRPDWVLARVIPIIQSIKSPVGPPRTIHWQAGPAKPAKPVDERPPNIVVILADDLGWNGVTRNGGFENGAVPTPNIDSIAESGVAFANSYAGSAVCAPSRAALLTGRYATRFGFEFAPVPATMTPMVNSLFQHNPLFSRKPILLTSNQESLSRDELGMPTSEITMAQILRRAGYHTAHIGKWHLGKADKFQPINRGFDESLLRVGFLHGHKDDPDIISVAEPYDPIDKFLLTIGRQAVSFNGGSLFSPKGYLADYFSAQAVKVIHANRNRPFFLYYAPWLVHGPLQAKRSDFNALSQIQDRDARVYGAMIRALDRSVGQVLQALKKNGIYDNTLVFFLSDNGAPGYMGLPDVNAPYRGWKLTFFEGGLRVPFYMQWPAQVRGEQRYRPRVQGVDVFSTALAAADAALPRDRKIDGVNLLPYVSGAKTGAPHDTLFWRNGGYRILIDGHWKLQTLAYPEKVGHPDKVLLFDLKMDSTEQHNVAQTHPDVVERLLQTMADIDTQQAKPLWGPTTAMPVTIDKTTADKQSPDDEYIYWRN